MKYLVDSVIVIDHLNGRVEATRFLADSASRSALSVITRAEVLAGCDEHNERPVIALLDQFPTLPIDVSTADRAARLRRTERWKLPDAIQAAIAIGHDLTLVTRNTRDFRPGERLDVLIPYQF
ncbi:MAG: PIN domain-containing protein [Xanthomonadales bacterium]|nr:PIN domain-containing protein [Xanthomonadales bacterium]